MALKGNFEAQPYANESAANTALGNSRAPGSVYYDTGDAKLKVWTGAAWSAFGGGGGFPTDIPTSGLILHLDAGDSNSYGGSGTTWSDISSSGTDYDFTVDASSFVAAANNDPAHFDFSADTNAYCAYNTDGIPRSAANTVVLCCFRGPMRESVGSDVWRERIALSQRMSIGWSWWLVSSSNTRQIVVYDGGTYTPEKWGDDAGPTGSTPQNRQPEFGPDTEHTANMYTWRTQSTTSGNTPTFQLSINTGIVAGSNNSNMSAGGTTKLFHNIGGFGTNDTQPSGNYGWGKFVAVLAYNRLLTTAEEMKIYAHYHATCDFASQGVYTVTGGFT